MKKTYASRKSENVQFRKFITPTYLYDFFHIQQKKAFFSSLKAHKNKEFIKFLLKFEFLNDCEMTKTDEILF